MNFQIHPLTKELLHLYLQDIIRMSRENIEDEYWGEEHFQADLPGKWKLSLIVTDESGPAAFLIASEKESSVHIHKFVVDAHAQGKGLGGEMLKRLLEKSSKPITLKVRTDNENAIRFYKKKGFLAGNIQNGMIKMLRNLS